VDRAGQATSAKWLTRADNNIHRVSYKVFNLGQIEALHAKYQFASFDPETLYANGLISRTDKVKVLGGGELKSPLSFRVDAYSEKAKSAIESAGGKVELIAK
jgi:large subunit ribosomal protein L15